MLQRVLCDLTGGASVPSALFRYGVLDRVARCAKRQGVEVLAWGVDRHLLRLVVRAEADGSVLNMMRGVKVGTTRALADLGHHVRPDPPFRTPIADGDLQDSVVWAHMAPLEEGVDPLSSPWSSHRDLMCFRSSRWSATPQVDARVVHQLCGGEELPEGWPPRGGHDSLHFLLRMAGSVLGVLPGDRRSFRLFVHLAIARGFSKADLADALVLTQRRIRQLAAATEPQLDLGLCALADPRLRCVP
jgi:hypothetical protein